MDLRGSVKRSVDWYEALPPYTKAWLTATVAVTAIGNIGLISPDNFSIRLSVWQFWRPLSCALYSPLMPWPHTAHFCTNLYFISTCAKELELTVYRRDGEGYGKLLTFSWMCSVLLGALLEMSFVMDPMVNAVQYVWCYFNRDAVLQFFGVELKAKHLPWVVLLKNTLLYGEFINNFLGILIGCTFVTLQRLDDL